MSDVFREASAYYMVGRPPYSRELLPVLRARAADCMAADACSTWAAAPVR